MSLLTEVFKSHERTFSFEVFPAKTPEGHLKLLNTLKELCLLKPDFISCTYGAGGGNREKTLDIVEHIQKSYGVPAMAHLTCVLHTKTEIKAIVDNIRHRNIKNILALRGDPPKDNPDWKPGPDNYRYSSELVAFIRQHLGDDCCIGVAGFPNGHVLAPDRQLDAQYLKEKINAGADFVITQLFFDNKDYFDYVRRLRALGVKARIIPGVLPITDYNALIRFCDVCGEKITPEVHAIFNPIKEDLIKTKEAGIDFAIRQCRALLEGGAPGIHFYTLNKIHPVDVILKELRPAL
jgi:methylenetetrahydrofolate reductase (NADPH)